MPGVQRSAVRRPEHDLLGIYLNDHLAGATIGLDLARRMARAYRGGAIGAALGPIVIEIAEDRESLKGMMATLGIPVRHYKVYAAWLAEEGGARQTERVPDEPFAVDPTCRARIAPTRRRGQSGRLAHPPGGRGQ